MLFLRLNEDRRTRVVLENDEAMLEWGGPMVVRARVYRRISPDQEFMTSEHSFLFPYGDLRRPVRMRGSKNMRRDPGGNWNSRADWAHKLRDRYLRRFRFTILFREQYDSVLEALEKRMNQKDVWTGRNFIDHGNFRDGLRWIDGKKTWNQEVITEAITRQHVEHRRRVKENTELRRAVKDLKSVIHQSSR